LQASHRKGIEVLTEQKVLTLIGNANGKVVEVHTPEHILACQIVIWASERKPDTELAEAAGLPLEDGAIAVNSDMETKIPGIYAIGDCAGERNLCTAVLRTEVGRIFDFYVAKTGFSTQGAKEAGYDPESVLVTAHDEPMYSHAAQEMIALLIVDRVTRKLLGAQFLGESPVESLQILFLL
jgi:Pyridine nucleotide-disulphide oxidoreductase, dimerisation domain./Pyridine nucleotide-disulphide oxidoreductase.